MTAYQNCRNRCHTETEHLSQVFDHVWVLSVTLQVVSRHQILNPLLDELEVSLEHSAELLHNLHCQLLVLEDLAGLHGTHDGSINSISPVLVQVLNHLLALIDGR